MAGSSSLEGHFGTGLRSRFSSAWSNVGCASINIVKQHVMIFSHYFCVAYLAFKCTGPIMPSNNGSNLLSPLKKVNSGSSKRLEMPNQLFDAEKKLD